MMEEINEFNTVTQNENDKVETEINIDDYNNLLIVVDMQNDFIDGALANKDAEAIVDPIIERIKEYLLHNHDVIFTMDTHQFDYMDTIEGVHLPVPHCIKGTKGWLINEKIFNAISEIIKDYPDKGCFIHYIEKETFGYNNWYIDLNDDNYVSKYNLDAIELVGTCTDICVVSNALILKAQYPDIEIYVNEKLCAGTTKENHDAAIQTMKMCQVNII